MFDEVQRGWLAGDDYRRAVERHGVRELPDDGEPEREIEPGPLPPEVSSGRWVDDDPPGCPR
ncbi:MAG TPA: hypothetical protein VIR27_08335 [Mycobacteriales bacterium]